MIRVNGNLPICVLDVSDTDTFGASDQVNVVLKISHRPGLADDVFVDCTCIINTETRLTILASYDGNGRSPRARALLDYIIVEHILNTLVDNGFSARVSSMSRVYLKLYVPTTDDGSQVWYQREGETLLRQCCTYPAPLVITIRQDGILRINPDC